MKPNPKPANALWETIAKSNEYDNSIPMDSY